MHRLTKMGQNEKRNSFMIRDILSEKNSAAAQKGDPSSRDRRPNSPDWPHETDQHFVEALSHSDTCQTSPKSDSFKPKCCAFKSEFNTKFAPRLESTNENSNSYRVISRDNKDFLESAMKQRRLSQQLYLDHSVLRLSQTTGGRPAIPALVRPTTLRAPRPRSPEHTPGHTPVSALRTFTGLQETGPMLSHPLHQVPGPSRVPPLPPAHLPAVDYGYYYGSYSYVSGGYPYPTSGGSSSLMSVPIPLPIYIRSRGCDDDLINGRAKKCRRSRTVFTELQLMGLEKKFEDQKYLSTPDRADLARGLGLTQIQVKTWYQNRRMKWKKQVMLDGGSEPPTKPKGRPKKQLEDESEAEMTSQDNGEYSSDEELEIND